MKRDYVLIPVWCNWNDTIKISTEHDSEVLIPVWCNWNEQIKAYIEKESLF